VHFDDTAGIDLELPGDQSVGTLFLRSDSDQINFSISRHDAAIGSEWDGIPYGSYDVRFESKRGYFCYPDWQQPALSIQIGGQAVEFTIASGGLGKTQLLPEFIEQRSEYTGPMIVRILDLGHAGSFYANFERAPYMIDLLPSGQYSMEFVDIPGGGINMAAAADLRVEPGVRKPWALPVVALH
jgi:hypothetical protein